MTDTELEVRARQGLKHYHAQHKEIVLVRRRMALLFFGRES